MALNVSILYRGPLSSCNYGCTYCPFAKHRETREELEVDRQSLNRFVRFVEETPDVNAVFFTPWGEALIRPWYHDAIQRLGACTQIKRVSAQTNLAYNPKWLAACDPAKIALWCTYHPTETDEQTFLKRCKMLNEMGIAFSVGAVAMREHIDQIESLRAALSPETYFWINAYKRQASYYSEIDITRLTAIDPLFPVNMVHFASLNRACGTGRRTISIDGEGNVYRCHFIKDRLGNIYQQPLSDILIDRACTAQSCGCHIGYVYIEDLNLQSIYREGILERIPGEKLWIPGTLARSAATQFVADLLNREANSTTLTINGRLLPV